MKKILLISNRVMHYRSHIYNKFFDMFAGHGYEFHVLSNDYQSVDFPIRFIKHEKPFSIKGYIDSINEINPAVCINFLHLKDKLIIPLTLFCRYKGIPMIYWNHGINIKTPNAKLKNFIFHFIHSISNAIILYSPDQLKYLAVKNQKKTFIAWNTLDFSDVKKENLRSVKEVKTVYGIKEERVVMYISRILPYKGLDILLNLFVDTPNIALVVVGGGINDTQRKIIENQTNYYYLGEKYGREVNEIYQMGDVFSTPGHIGLALNQAMYWGKPIVVLDRIHAPEICYLQQGINGYIVKDEQELKSTIIRICSDDIKLKQLSKGARTTYEERMGIDNMFRGFYDAIKYCESNC